MVARVKDFIIIQLVRELGSGQSSLKVARDDASALHRRFSRSTTLARPASRQTPDGCWTKFWRFERFAASVGFEWRLGGARDGYAE